jgi:integrase
MPIVTERRRAGRRAEQTGGRGEARIPALCELCATHLPDDDVHVRSGGNLEPEAGRSRCPRTGAPHPGVHSNARGRDGRPKTGKSKRDVVIHGNLLEVLVDHRRTTRARDGFVFTTPGGAPIDQMNFYGREWVPMLEEFGVRLRPFYNARHTYITYLLSLGSSPLFVARQTGTSLEMIEAHYGGITAVADELDEKIRERENSETRNPP